MSATTAPAIVVPITRQRSRSYWAGVFRRLSRDYVTIAFATLLLLMLLAILFAPLLAPHDPYQTSMLRRLKPAGFPGYPLGTDELGRDMLTRLLYGGRLSWAIGITPVVLAFFIGGLLGVIAGFAGGAVNMIIMRTTDVFYAFPSVLLAVAISGALGGGISNAILSLTLVFVPQIIRVAETRHHECANAGLRGGGAGQWRRVPADRARARAAERAGADLRLRHQPDQRVDDPGLGAVLPRPGHPPAGAGNGG